MDFRLLDGSRRTGSGEGAASPGGLFLIVTQSSESSLLRLGRANGDTGVAILLCEVKRNRLKRYVCVV
jgi:hypothetical protein